MPRFSGKRRRDMLQEVINSGAGFSKDLMRIESHIKYEDCKLLWQFFCGEWKELAQYFIKIRQFAKDVEEFAEFLKKFSENMP